MQALAVGTALLDDLGSQLHAGDVGLGLLLVGSQLVDAPPLPLRTYRRGGPLPLPFRTPSSSLEKIMYPNRISPGDLDPGDLIKDLFNRLSNMTIQ